jgi:hypothetical protein
MWGRFAKMVVHMRLAITARMCIFECGWMGRAACYAAQMWVQSLWVILA